MSFLGGVDLGKPADRARQALTRDLELQRSAWTPVPEQAQPTVYRGSADLVLQHGVFNMGQTLPDAYGHLFQLVGPSLCFYNALEAVQQDPSLRYCEGYCTLGRGEPWLHAWCLAPDDSVLEVTYEDNHAPTASARGLPTLPSTRWAYYGIVLHPDYVGELQTEDHGPMLERLAPEIAGTRHRQWDETNVAMRESYPLLTYPYDPNRTTS